MKNVRCNVPYERLGIALSHPPGPFAHPSVVVHKYVGGLYISMTYAIAVDALKSLGDLLHQWE